mmetsp:Transcript_45277/g.88948  ORF Transcript_45277/g.88948 Transcript_45277/m.88948 type:complete len:1774 (+) Transcript_45277:2501-7822(+)
MRGIVVEKRRLLKEQKQAELVERSASDAEKNEFEANFAKEDQALLQKLANSETVDLEAISEQFGIVFDDSSLANFAGKHAGGKADVLKNLMKESAENAKQDKMAELAALQTRRKAHVVEQREQIQKDVQQKTAAGEDPAEIQRLRLALEAMTQKVIELEAEQSKEASALERKLDEQQSAVAEIKISEDGSVDESAIAMLGAALTLTQKGEEKEFKLTDPDKLTMRDMMIQQRKNLRLENQEKLEQAHAAQIQAARDTFAALQAKVATAATDAEKNELLQQQQDLDLESMPARLQLVAEEADLAFVEDDEIAMKLLNDELLALPEGAAIVFSPEVLQYFHVSVAETTKEDVPAEGTQNALQEMILGKRQAERDTKLDQLYQQQGKEREDIEKELSETRSQLSAALESDDTAAIQELKKKVADLGNKLTVLIINQTREENRVQDQLDEEDADFETNLSEKLARVKDDSVDGTLLQEFELNLQLPDPAEAGKIMLKEAMMAKRKALRMKKKAALKKKQGGQLAEIDQLKAAVNEKKKQLKRAKKELESVEDPVENAALREQIQQQSEDLLKQEAALKRVTKDVETAENALDKEMDEADNKLASNLASLTKAKDTSLDFSFINEFELGLEAPKITDPGKDLVKAMMAEKRNQLRKKKKRALKKKQAAAKAAKEREMAELMFQEDSLLGEIMRLRKQAAEEGPESEAAKKLQEMQDNLLGVQRAKENTQKEVQEQEKKDQAEAEKMDDELKQEEEKAKQKLDAKLDNAEGDSYLNEFDDMIPQAELDPAKEMMKTMMQDKRRAVRARMVVALKKRQRKMRDLAVRNLERVERSLESKRAVEDNEEVVNELQQIYEKQVEQLREMQEKQAAEEKAQELQLDDEDDQFNQQLLAILKEKPENEIATAIKELEDRMNLNSLDDPVKLLAREVMLQARINLRESKKGQVLQVVEDQKNAIIVQQAEAENEVALNEALGKTEDVAHLKSQLEQFHHQIEVLTGSKEDKIIALEDEMEIQDQLLEQELDEHMFGDTGHTSDFMLVKVLDKYEIPASKDFNNEGESLASFYIKDTLFARMQKIRDKKIRALHIQNSTRQFELKLKKEKYEMKMAQPDLSKAKVSEYKGLVVSAEQEIKLFQSQREREQKRVEEQLGEDESEIKSRIGSARDTLHLVYDELDKHLHLQEKVAENCIYKAELEKLRMEFEAEFASVQQRQAKMAEQKRLQQIALKQLSEEKEAFFKEKTVLEKERAAMMTEWEKILKHKKTIAAEVEQVNNFRVSKASKTKSRASKLPLPEVSAQGAAAPSLMTLVPTKSALMDKKLIAELHSALGSDNRFDEASVDNILCSYLNVPQKNRIKMANSFYLDLDLAVASEKEGRKDKKTKLVLQIGNYDSDANFKPIADTEEEKGPDCAFGKLVLNMNRLCKMQLTSPICFRLYDTTTGYSAGDMQLIGEVETTVADIQSSSGPTALQLLLGGSATGLSLKVVAKLCVDNTHGLKKYPSCNTSSKGLKKTSDAEGAGAQEDKAEEKEEEEKEQGINFERLTRCSVRLSLGVENLTEGQAAPFIRLFRKEEDGSWSDTAVYQSQAVTGNHVMFRKVWLPVYDLCYSDMHRPIKMVALNANRGNKEIGSCEFTIHQVLQESKRAEAVKVDLTKAEASKGLAIFQGVRGYSQLSDLDALSRSAGLWEQYEEELAIGLDATKHKPVGLHRAVLLERARVNGKLQDLEERFVSRISAYNSQSARNELSQQSPQGANEAGSRNFAAHGDEEDQKHDDPVAAADT